MSNPLAIVCPEGFDAVGTGLAANCKPDINFAWTCNANTLTIDSINKNHLFNIDSSPGGSIIPDMIKLEIGDATKPGCAEQSFDFNNPASTQFLTTCFNTMMWTPTDMIFNYDINVNIASNQNDPNFAASFIINDKHYKFPIGCKGATATTVETDLTFDYLENNVASGANLFNNNQFPGSLISITAEYLNGVSVRLNDPFSLKIENNFDPALNVHAIVQKCEYEYNGDATRFPIYERCPTTLTSDFLTGASIAWSSSSPGPNIVPGGNAVIDMTAFIFANTPATTADKLTPKVHCDIQFCSGICSLPCSTAG